jgi:hypothetical protein
VPCVVEIDDMQLFLSYQDVSRMKVTVEADLSNISGALIARFNTIEHLLDDAFIGRSVVLGNEVVIEEILDGLGSIGIDVDARPVFEPRNFPFEVNACDQASQLLLQFIVV